MPPKQSGGGVEEAEWRRREQSIDPKTEAVLAEAESSGASAKNARGWRCLGRNRLTEGVFVKTAISVLRVGSIILALPSAGGDKSSLPCKGVVSASQTMNERNVPGAWNVGGFFLYGWEERG